MDESEYFQRKQESSDIWLSSIETMTIGQIVDVLAEKDIERDEYRDALVGKAVDGHKLITVSRDKLDEWIDSVKSCKDCPMNYCCSKKRQDCDCRDKLLRWMVDYCYEGDEEDEGST